MKIGLCSWSNRKNVSSLTWPLMNKYCKKHGYTFTTSDEHFKVGVDESWMKLKMLQQHTGLDYLVWFDDDIVITGDTKIEKFIQEMGTDALFGLSRCSGTAGQKKRFIFNMGIVIVKCCDVSMMTLDDLWCSGIKSKWKNKKLWEQDYITYRYKTDYTLAKQIYLFGYGTIQTYVRPYGLPEKLSWKSGDFSAHITGHACNSNIKTRRVNSFIKNNI